MFYDVFKKLCDDRGINPTRASVEIGFSRGSVSYWKKRYLEGFDAKPDSYTAEMIADYVDVSVDYLLGRTDDPIDYDKNGDALAEIPLTYVEAANGDMKKARQMMLAVDADALRERDAMPEVYRQYLKLDEIDRAKVEAYITGLLSSDKYQTVAKAKNA